jgi:putative copper resistance protein D
VGLPFLAVQLIQMMRADKREAEEIDAELDARDAARAEAEPAPADADGADRPWWETDPRLTDRFRKA